MNHEDDGMDAEWMDDDGATFAEVEFSSLTWDDETVRETHREIEIRARRAASRLF